MNSLSDRILSAFSEQGLLQGSPGFRHRPAQVQMAVAVAAAIESGTALAVEAGTGIGKTLAYLAPLLIGRRRALLSTATQSLQDQLFLRDIPALVQALGQPVRVAVLKGRSRYVCIQRLSQSPDLSAMGADPALVAQLARVRQWAVHSHRGDLAELPFLDERSALRPWITSTRDNCLRDACPRRDGCHVDRARREALQADWVVINHHLFFSQLQGDGAWMGGLVERAEVVVFDEAHRLNGTGIESMAHSLDTGALRALARDVATQAPRWAQGQRAWAHMALVLDQTARDRPPYPSGRHAWAPAHHSAWTHGLDMALEQVLSALSATAGASADMERLYQRALRVQASWNELTEAHESAESLPASARWLEVGSAGWAVVRAPLDVSGHIASAMALPGAGRSWVFTSATLGADDALDGFTVPLGLQGHAGLKTLCLRSPFDHARQLALYVPDDVPDPSDTGHTPALAHAVARWASRIGGHTLVLTTTLRAAARLSDTLQGLVRDGRCEALQILGEGHMSRQALLARFRAAADSTEAGAVLVASMAFWEGVDIAGEALQLLVIDKLPFAPPDDPLTAAQARRLEALGHNAFVSLHLPQAAMALKQGAGRLIRSETDQGVLVVADRRLTTRSYGQRLLDAMPPMQRLLDEADLLKALDRLVLTRASTRGR